MHTEVGMVVLGGLGHELMRAVVGVLDPRGGGQSMVVCTLKWVRW